MIDSKKGIIFQKNEIEGMFELEEEMYFILFKLYFKSKF